MFMYVILKVFRSRCIHHTNSTPGSQLFLWDWRYAAEKPCRTPFFVNALKRRPAQSMPGTASSAYHGAPVHITQQAFILRHDE